MILFVDDEDDVRRVVQRLLRLRGYACACAGGVVNAFELLQTDRRAVQLVILDWMMPDQSGADFLRDLADSPGLSGLPVIVYTAAPVEDVRGEALSLGARAIVSKGEPFESLLARVAEYTAGGAA